MQIFNDVIFGNVGKKIKTLAIVVFVVGFMVSAAVGIMLLSWEDAGGLVVWIGGALVSWISSLMIYGQGELIEKATQIAENTKNEK